MKPKQPLHKQLLGKKGEDIAASFLIKHGYRIIERNFKVRYGELDIIAVKDNMLVFVEVKTRENTAFGLPEEQITPSKLHELKQTAAYYTLTNPDLPKQQRMDLVAILLTDTFEEVSIKHIQNITQ